MNDYVLCVRSHHGHGEAAAYNPGRWVASFFLAGVLLPWLAGAGVWFSLGPVVDTGAHPVPGIIVFAATWNFVIAALIPPVALMLVARTHTGPITWRRLDEDDRTLFAKTMFAIFCGLDIMLFALVWYANDRAIIPVMMTAFLPTLVAALASALVATMTLALAQLARRYRRERAASHSFDGRHPA